MIKKCVLILCLLFITESLPQQDNQIMVTDFATMLSALDQGKNLNVVVHYGKCRLMIDSLEEKSPDVTGGMKIEEFEYFPANTIRNPKGYIATSKTVLISHSRYGYVWNYIKFRFYENGEVEINARYIDPLTLETKMNETFHGALSDKTTDRGVHLFLK